MSVSTEPIRLALKTTDFLNKTDHGLLIGGEWSPARSGETFSVYNPSDGTRLAELAVAGPEDVDRAVAAARAALRGHWAGMTPAAREERLRRLGDLIAEHAGELAELESLDNGKPISHTTAYGLSGGVWTRDVGRAHRVAAAIKSGVVWVNTYDLFASTVPFGGFKQSGYGRDNGQEAIEALTEVKSAWVSTQ